MAIIAVYANLAFGQAPLQEEISVTQNRLTHTREQVRKLKQSAQEVRQILNNNLGKRSQIEIDLQQIETAISKNRRQQRKIDRDYQENTKKLQRIEKQYRIFKTQLLEQQRELSNVLRQQAYMGQRSSIQALLSSTDPNQTSRNLYYLSRITAHRLATSEQLVTALNKEKRLLAEIKTKRANLIALDDKAHNNQIALEIAVQKRTAILHKIEHSITHQKDQLASLSKNQAALEQLLQEITKKIEVLAIDKNRHLLRQTKQNLPLKNKRYRRAVGKLFSQLKGRLHAPLSGRTFSGDNAKEFGGLGNARGIYIMSPAGEDVHAVADGQIVWADWLRGYSQMIIIGHDKNYLTVYGNNQALHAEIGDRVQAGDVIAEVGHLPGAKKSGVYFELRRNGVAINALKWLKK